MKTQDGSTLKVGDTITVFDDTVRVYPKRADGTTDYNSHARYEAKFVQREIVGETKVSWVLLDRTKINKKTMEGTYSPEGVEQAIWTHNNRHWLIEALKTIAYTPVEGDNYETLKAVADLIGYEERKK